MAMLQQPLLATSSYADGEKVNYWSDRRGCWFTGCTVVGTDPDGGVRVSIAGNERTVPKERLATHLKKPEGHHAADIACAPEMPAENVQATEDTAEELKAKARVASFLVHMLLTAPVAFMIRYVDAGFLKIYLRLRPKNLVLKLTVYFFLILCLLPYGYFNAAMANPCKEVNVILSGENHTRQYVTMQGEQNCHIYYLLQSWKSLLFGPICLAPCGLVALIGICCANHRRLDQMLLYAQGLMPGVPFSGLGPRLRTGTGGLAPYMMIPKEFYRWRHDALGAIDVIMLLTVANISCGVLMVVAPGVVAFASKFDMSSEGAVQRSLHDSVIAAAKSSGVGAAAALVIVPKILFPASNFLFGAPGRLAKIMAGGLLDAECTDQLGKDPHTQARYLLGEAWPKKANEQGKAKLAEQLSNLEKKVPQVPDMKLTPMLPADGLLHGLYSSSATSLNMKLGHFNRLVSMSQMGWVLAMVDPDYETLHYQGFNKQFVVDSIYIPGLDHLLLVETGGLWDQLA